MPNMNTEVIDKLRANQILSTAITRALMEIHRQTVGVRVTAMEVTIDPLNPPGHGYSIKASAQVTLKNEKEEVPV